MRALRPNKKKADALCGSLVRARGYCEVNDEKTAEYHKGQLVLQWGHIISRSYYTIRWDLGNALCICSKHHSFYTPRSLQWADYIDKHFGKDYYFILKRDALGYRKIYYPTIMEYLNSCKESGDLWGKEHVLSL